MSKVLCLTLVALALANVVALPLAGGFPPRCSCSRSAPLTTGTVVSGDEAPNAMFSDNEDEATLSAEMEKVCSPCLNTSPAVPACLSRWFCKFVFAGHQPRPNGHQP